MLHTFGPAAGVAGVAAVAATRTNIDRYESFMLRPNDRREVLLRRQESAWAGLRIRQD